MSEQNEVLIDIRERLVRVETKLDAQNGLKEKATETESRSKSNTHRIDKIEANLTWLWRSIAGALIVAGVGAVVVFK